MKQIKTLVIAVVAFFGMQSMNAQTTVAHVDVNELTSKMPAILDAQKQLQKLGETYNAEYNAMVTEYKTKIEKSLFISIQRNNIMSERARALR